MNTEQVAKRLVEHCRQAHWEAAQTELYSEDAVSIEPEGNGMFAKETNGRAAIIEKGHKFNAMIETVHSLTVSEPVVAPQSFACSMSFDVTMKGQGRMPMAELCVYEVKEGKIVSERFFR